MSKEQWQAVDGDAQHPAMIDLTKPTKTRVRGTRPLPREAKAALKLALNGLVEGAGQTTDVLYK